MKKLIYFVTEDWYFLSHRLPMAHAAMKMGFDVSVIANVGSSRKKIEAEGIKVIPFPMQRRSLNPFSAVGQVWSLARIYRHEKPDLVHHIAMKPVLFGSMAAWLAGVPRVLNAFAGLGVVFETDILKARILRPVLLISFYILFRRKGFWTLFQNADNRDYLIRVGVCKPERSIIIRGSGVDTAEYPEAPLPPTPPFICVLAARMIDVKGLPTLKEAFDILSAQSPSIHLWLCGIPDPDNPGSWDEARLNAWCAENKNVIWKGHQNMAAIWPQAHLALQPSWGGEGLPKSLLVAASCGRAIVASDVAGCREVVESGRNGYLVLPKDADALAKVILDLADDRDRCLRMGKESRKMVESGLSAESVTAQTTELYQRILNS